MTELNKTVTQIVKHSLDNYDVQEGFLNRVEAEIRCYDPCLSCSTHAIYQMPLKIEVMDASGSLINTD